MKNKKIFISHSAKDKKIIDIFIDKILQNGIGINHSEIFCTSIEGLKITTGEEWRKAIQENLLNAEIIILIITPNYKESEMCLAEIGVAWTSGKNVIPVIVPPVDFENLSVIYKVIQALKLTASTDLDILKDDLAKILCIKEIPSDRWTVKKQEGISLIEQEITKNPFQKTLSRKEFDNINNELIEIKKTLNNLINEKQKLSEYCTQLERIKDKAEIKNVQKELGMIDEYDEFIKYSEKVGDKINELSFPIRKLLFNHLSQKNIRLTQQEQRDYENALNVAIADDLIDEELDLNICHKKIASIIELWNRYEELFKEMENKFLAEIEENYPDITIQLDNLSYWKDVLGVKI